jgi:hypothetical protein
VFAKVLAAGSVAQQRGVVGIGGLVPGNPRETGVYRITFDRDVSQCVPAVTRAAQDLPQLANIRVIQQPATPADMIVLVTAGDTSTPSNIDFYIAVVC